MKAHGNGLASPSSTGKSLRGGSSVTVALVEDNAEFADALTACLSHQPDLEVLGILSTVMDALGHLPVWKPDIVLLDLGLPDGSGIEVLRVLSPSMTDTTFVVLTVFEDDESIREALSAGALGYMLKCSGSRAILEGVSLAAGGGSPLDAQITRRLLEVLRSHGAPESQAIRDLTELTAKENLLLRQMAKTGESVKEIADVLGLTYATVRTYIRRIYVKLGVHNRSQAERRLLRLHQDPS
jgi:DNA-binding NarL/FixJ family response regulator